MRVAIVGCGRMGRAVERLASEHGCQITRMFRSAGDFGDALHRQEFSGSDVAIEFTTPHAAPENLRCLMEAGIPTVIGTTGWFNELPRLREFCEAKNGSVVWGPNFSVGLYHFRATVAEAARRLAREESYGAWGWEIHHAAKKDAPSGTLLALAEDITRSGFARPVSLAANRAGLLAGTHEIGFDSAEDSITLRHTAHSRDGFARGALRAARWLVGKKGFFEFREIVDEL